MADKISEGDFEDRLTLGTTKSCLKSFFKLEFKPKLIHYHDHLYYSTLKLLRAIAISVHMLCLLHIYCIMFIAALKTNIYYAMNYLKAHAISGNMLCLVFSSLTIFFNYYHAVECNMHWSFTTEWIEKVLFLSYSPQTESRRKLVFSGLFLAFALSNQQHIVQLMHIKSKIMYLPI